MNVEKLIKVLNKEYKIYQDVYRLAEEKETAIIDEDLDQLEEVVRQEDEYSDQLEKLEQAREQLAEGRDLTAIIDQLEGEQREQLETVRKKLARLVEKIQDQNELNNKLLRDSLQLININLNLLQAGQQNDTYGKQGQFNEGEGPTTMINEKA